jgi:hypothetical protein
MKRTRQTPAAMNHSAQRKQKRKKKKKEKIQLYVAQTTSLFPMLKPSYSVGPIRVVATEQ